MKIFSIIMVVYCIIFYIRKFIKTKKKFNLIQILILTPILIEVIR